VRTGIAMTDYLAGLYAFAGILLALRERDRTGLGRQVDISLFDSVLSTLSMPIGILQATGRAPTRMGNDHAAIAPYETLTAADGSVMVAAANPRLWRQLCRALGREHLVSDARFLTNTERVANRTALKAELEGVMGALSVDQVVDRLERAGVPCGRVRTVAEALADPQVDARQMMLDLGDPELDGFRVLGNPIKFTGETSRPVRRPPKLGEHTREILAELGWDAAVDPHTA
jgi:crotonobetainyl-CoA:carnitine CoA-transferase CaiB-like acyl-CoA transferase